MKTGAHSLLALAAIASTTLAAPTPATADISFPITDLADTDFSPRQYLAKLESEAHTLSKRQYGGTTYNQLTDGTACRPISVIYARGTNGAGNVGEAGSEGPSFFNALASRLGGTGQLAIQGVNYPATVLGFLAGGDANGATTLFNLINTTITRCPSTKIVLSGYSQGAQLVHTATQRLTAAAAARVNAVVTFGDPDRDESFGPVAASKVLIICHDGDNICDNGIIITPAHSNYEIDAPAAAAFVAARV
ncbi:hypothetical protein ACJQWK_03441 [Exserohilum turcicum]|uniref:Cutinase n=1 Tax=Exserohilum turcicum (strain 28A) TaxID=671987 RepID=R0J2P9_EXST2|nr:carbohydrate esterase family 5 protein [Exserohilum turcica Et28A]EOA91235.1 carbohydrate esterase family 5 protein [Exserohilum turcica Et28A]